MVGAATTFLGIMPLAFANNVIFRVFFKMFLVIISFGVRRVRVTCRSRGVDLTIDSERLALLVLVLVLVLLLVFLALVGAG